jgi:tetratricopeptide (TPR) repeat protein
MDRQEGLLRGLSRDSSRTSVALSFEDADVYPKDTLEGVKRQQCQRAIDDGLPPPPLTNFKRLAEMHESSQRRQTLFYIIQRSSKTGRLTDNAPQPALWVSALFTGICLVLASMIAIVCGRAARIRLQHDARAYRYGGESGVSLTMTLLNRLAVCVSSITVVLASSIIVYCTISLRDAISLADEAFVSYCALQKEFERSADCAAALVSIQQPNVRRTSRVVDLITFSVVSVAFLYLVGGLLRIFGPIWRQTSITNPEVVAREHGTLLSIDDPEQHRLLQRRTSSVLAEELEAEHSTDERFLFPDDPANLPSPGQSRVSSVSPEPSVMPTPASEVQVSDSIELTELISLDEVQESSAASLARTEADEYGLSYLTQSSHGVGEERRLSTSAQLPRAERNTHPFPESAGASGPPNVWQAAAAHDSRFTTMLDSSKTKNTGMLPMLPGPTSDVMMLPIKAKTRAPQVASEQDHNPSLETHSLLAANDVASASDSDSNQAFSVENSDIEEKLVVETRKTKLGADHLQTLSSTTNLASTYRNQGQWEEAAKLDAEVMETCKAKLGADHPDTLRSMANLALTYRNQGRWEEAEKLQVEVLETCKAKLGADHPDTLRSMANLALTYRNQGRWEDAEKLFVEVLETSKTKLGADHPDTLTSMANLASTYRNQGRWEEAEKLQVEVMETCKTKLGADHPDTLTSMANLASTYRKQGQWEDAEKLEVQVLETRKTKLGEDHPDTLTSMANLASTYRNQGRWEDAEKLDVQVLETRKMKLGEDHPDTLTSMANLASTYWSQGQWEDAEKLEVQVLETSKTKLGEDHPSTLTSMHNLAFTWKSLGRSVEAMALMQQCVQQRRQVLRDNHPNLVSSLRVLEQWEAEEAEEAGKTDANVPCMANDVLLAQGHKYK